MLQKGSLLILPASGVIYVLVSAMIPSIMVGWKAVEVWKASQSKQYSISSSAGQSEILLGTGCILGILASIDLFCTNDQYWGQALQDGKRKLNDSELIQMGVTISENSLFEFKELVESGQDFGS